MASSTISTAKTEWHSGILPITLQRHHHDVEYHIHHETGGTWAFLSYYWFDSVPSGYWFRIDEWANTTGYANVDVLASAVPNTSRFTVRHLAFQSSFLKHFGIPDFYGRPDSPVNAKFTEEEARHALLAEKYGEYVDCVTPNPPDVKFRSIPVCAAPESIPALNDGQRLFMIKYSLVHVFDWIGHLWAQYPIEAPAIALMHTSATSYPHWQCSLPEFTA
ncbi:hypothetical protein GGF32_001773 [Allomyces javanicus]|nr:hypothetical protein GGF32_001773 [Allomyces javanicus]